MESGTDRDRDENPTEQGGSSLLLVLPLVAALGLRRDVGSALHWPLVVAFQLVSSWAYNAHHTALRYLADLLGIYLIGYVYLREAGAPPLLLAALELALLAAVRAARAEDQSWERCWAGTPAALSFGCALLYAGRRAWGIPYLRWPGAVLGVLGPALYYLRLHIYRAGGPLLARAYAPLTYAWHACVSLLLALAALTLQ